MSLASINPYSLETIRTFPECPPDEMLRIVAKTVEARQEWAHTELESRCSLLRELAKQLRDGIHYHARTITLEMGKPITEARAEIEKCAALCDHYAEHGPGYLQSRPLSSDHDRSFVRYEPIGIVLAIMPWNFPYWQVFRAVIPAILAGNGAILKHASNVTSCALSIEALFPSCGFPCDLMRAIPVTGANTALLIAHPHIAGLSFTGSNEAGEKIAGLAGTQIKRTVLELGGSDAALVLHDADLDLAAERTVRGRMLNAGQSCIASKRILVHTSVLDDYLDRVRHHIDKLEMGDPLEPSTTLGPLATQSVHEQIQQQVEGSILKGANCWMPERYADAALKGWQYAPTLLTQVTPEMPVWNEETFGPVLCVSTFANEREAVQLANHTRWGLGASIYSIDLERALGIGEQIEVGTCTINDIVKSDPRIPFGGVKKSGYGRELGIEGIREFTNVKTYHIQS